MQTTKRFIRFCLVGASGVFVDMAMLYLMADPTIFGCGLTISKILAAETAIVNNFAWNEFWTFRDISFSQAGLRSRLGRFLKFNLICLAGIGLSVLLLNLQVHSLHVNLYVANFIAIFTSSIWNFGMNLKFGWIKSKRAGKPQN